MKTRTTLTLDPDVAAALDALKERSGLQLKVIVNTALRLGLREIESEGSAPSEHYMTEPFDPGPPALVGVHSVADLLAFAEGEDFR